MKTTLKLSAVAGIFLLSSCNQNDAPAPGRQQLAAGPLLANLNLRIYSSPRSKAQALTGGKLNYVETLPPTDAKHPGFGVYKLVLAP